MLEVQDLWVSYGRASILRGTTLSVPDGEVVALLGTNGAGKSTLLRALAGLHRPDKGTVSLAGVDIGGLPAWERTRRGLSLVPEGQQTFPAMTVQENLWVGAQLHEDTLANFDDHLDRTFEMFPRLGERSKQLAGTLSGGERQMLAIARALLSEPKVLMLDEPSHGLAPQLIEQLAEKIALIARSTAVLLVEQNLAIPTHCATQVIVLANAEIVLRGAADEVLSSESLVTTYLGA